MAAGALQNIAPLNEEITDGGKVRYTTGRYETVDAAVSRKEQVWTQGIPDAFVTAYYEGERITIARARDLMSGGVDPDATFNSAPATPNVVEGKSYDIVIGTYDGEVPANVARALLFLEAKYEIKQELNNGRTSYVTKLLPTQAQVVEAQSEFATYGIEIQEVREY